MLWAWRPSADITSRRSSAAPRHFTFGKTRSAWPRAVWRPSQRSCSGWSTFFFPGAFAFAYALPYPLALRWLGVTALAVGITVLWAAHHHLGRSFSSFVGVHDGHMLVESGPYRWIRHPIYLAFLLSYLGGGLAAGNWVLTFIPVACYAVLVGTRMPKEERLMTEIFGAEYAAYIQRTGRLLPRIGRAG